ncbi:Hsp33 family molecular chaperone HslO [Lentisphaerota bacterium WC36G]|nr:Hsp33 family molecular chaperone HslO [Lentisphaerae bacterium WC36]
MKNFDITIRGVINSLAIRFAYTEVTTAVTQAILIHDTDPVSSHILGQGIVNAALLNPLLGENEKYSLKWEYSGEIQSVLVDVDCNNYIRGIPKNPYLMESAKNEDDLYGGGDGKTSVIKFCMEDSKILNSGCAQAPLHDLGNDLGFYFSTSDQIETEFANIIGLQPDVEKPVKIATGVMLQALPDCDLIKFEAIRNRLHDEKVIQILQKNDSSEKKLRAVLRYITNSNEKDLDFGKNTVYSYTENSPLFKCSCSEEKMAQALKTLSKNDLDEIFADNQMPRIKCEFCKTEYTFSREDLEK